MSPIFWILIFAAALVLTILAFRKDIERISKYLTKEEKVGLSLPRKIIIYALLILVFIIVVNVIPQSRLPAHRVSYIFYGIVALVIVENIIQRRKK